MIKILLGFFILFMIFHEGISVFRSLTGKEKLDLTKSVFYAILCGSATVGLIAVIVFLF